MHLDAITDKPTPPEGTIETATGRLVPDDGHGILLAALDEAYESHATHVDVEIDDEPVHRLTLRDARHEGAFEIMPRLAACPGRVESMGADDQQGRRAELFRVDGIVVALSWPDPWSAQEA